MARIIGYRLPDGREITVEVAVLSRVVDEDGCPFDPAIKVLIKKEKGE